MGAERWMLAASPKEAERIKAYLEPTDGEMGVDDRYGCWFQWEGTRLEIGRTSWYLNSVCEAIIMRELARRFRFRRIGSDSTGWYQDNDLASADCIKRYGTWSSWVEWAKNYDLTWNMAWQINEGITETGQLLQEIEAWVVQQFKDLDTAQETT